MSRALLVLALALLALSASSPRAEGASTSPAGVASQGSIDIQGDVNCSGAVDSIDSLQILRGVAGLSTNAKCLTDAGDVDCDEDADSTDALRVLRFVASLPVQTPDGCTPIGEALGGGLLLNEVLFSPAQGDATFYEIVNIGGSAVNLKGVSLLNSNGVVLDLSDHEDVPPGGFFHAGGANLVVPDSGFLELRRDDEVLDRVAWGDQPDAVRLSRGSVAEELAPGTSINRAHGTAALDRSAWYTAEPTSSTPNAPPTPASGLPLSGAIFPAGPVTLGWYHVPGAETYRVRVATDEALSATVVDQTVAASRLTTQALAPGEYFWQVDAEPGSESPVQSLAIGAAALQATGPSTDQVMLDVEFQEARKDTAMLLLEGQNPAGDYAWDQPHVGIDAGDHRAVPSAYLASVQMLNNWYSGAISQDRLGFEVFKGRFNGPERDLPFGDALTREQGLQAVLFALGSADEFCSSNQQEMFAMARAGLDAGDPLLGISEHHAVLVTGYAVRAPGGGPAVPQQSYFVNDPLIGPYEVDAEKTAFSCFQGVSGSSIGALDEPEITADSDADGIVDFDETNRFGTNPADADTDGDGRSDKADVAESVFHPEFGYAGEVAFIGPVLGTRPPRDYDGDGADPELDCDNDNDGTPDGEDPDNYSAPPNPPVPAVCEGYALLTWNADSDLDLYLLPGPASSYEDTFQYRDLPGYNDDEEADCLLDPSDTQRSATLEISSTATTHVAVFMFSGCANPPDGPKGDGPDTVTFNLFVQTSDGHSASYTDTVTKEVDGWRLYTLAPP